MEAAFRTLLEFAARQGPDVSGRAVLEPEGCEAERLERFARGESSEEERAAVCELLRQHPGWIRWLAARVKLARVPVDHAA